jgi:hypothetical protein
MTPADQLVGRVSRDLAQRAIHERPTTVQVDQARPDGRPFEDLLEVGVGRSGDHVGGSACGDVHDHSHAAGDLGGSAPATLRAVEAQRSDVDHQRAAVLGAPDLARTRLTLERRAAQRLDQHPQALREGVPDESALAAGRRIASSPVLELLAGRQDEAKLAIEDEHPRPRQLAESCHRSILGTHGHPIWAHATPCGHGSLSVGANDYLTVAWRVA